MPFVNHVVPKEATNDAWRAGDPRAVVPAWVHLWWAVWLLENVLTNIATRPYWEPRKGLDEEQGFYGVDLASGVTGIAAALLAIAVVRSVTRRHAERLRDGPPAPPAPPPDEPFTIEPGWQPVPPAT